MILIQELMLLFEILFRDPRTGSVREKANFFLVLVRSEILKFLWSWSGLAQVPGSLVLMLKLEIVLTLKQFIH